MDRNLTQKIQEAIERDNTIGIVVGKNPNIDEMAAALALYLSLKTNGKNLSIACPTEPLVEHSSLIGIDKVKTFFSTDKGDLIVSFPYAQGEIEKVSYTLEDGFLNIIVKCGEDGLNFSEKDVQYKRANGVPGVLFVIGTARLSDLENLFDAEGLKNTTVINIDNKQDNQGFGDIVFVSQNYSSVSEQIASLLTDLQLPLDIDIAQNLFSGISVATENFQDQKTSPLAFEIAAVLLRKGATRQKLVRPRITPEVFSPFATPKMPVKQPPFQPKEQQKGFRPKNPFFSNRSQFQQQRPQQTMSGAQFSQKPTPPPFVEQKEDSTAPADWLTPKVYKGSTLI
ncbi:MAG: hypothetical protein HYV37_01065 [Candidatus Levyibacteriota bacterium]|nr:MAG: hypothetical protein HYV37_01065 [Candidatus Levybacteria bacterium]